MSDEIRKGTICAALLATAASLLVAASAVAAVPPEGDAAEPIYSPSAIVAIDLTLPQSSIEALEAEPEEEYQPGTFALASTDGTPGGIGAFSAPIEVGIRLKGGLGSFLPLGQKAAFKVKFSFVKGQRFLGLKKLTLNNMKQDPSMLHENLAYRSFRAAGVPSSRSGYAWVRLNGEPLGLYLNVEDLDDVSLEKRFVPFDDPQHLYEGEHGVDVAPGEADKYEVDEGDDEDLGDLEALIEAVNDPLAPDWSDRVDPHADLKEMTRMWAVEKYSGHWDGYAGDDRPEVPNNYFLYSEPDGRFLMLPWGTDQTWETKLAFDDPGGILFNACLADPSCAAEYESAAAATLAAIPPLDLGKVAACTAELLAPWQALEDEGLRIYDGEEIAAGVAETRELLADRPAELAAFLGVEAPGTPPADESCSVVVEDSIGGAQPPRPAPPTPSGLRLEGARIHPRVLIAQLVTGAAGRIQFKATYGPRRNRHLACAATARLSTPGPNVVRCPLTREARRRIAQRRVWLHLVANFHPQAAAPESASRNVRSRPPDPGFR